MTRPDLDQTRIGGCWVRFGGGGAFDRNDEFIANATTLKQRREAATVGTGGGRVGRGGMANNHLEEQHLLVQINKKGAEKAAIGNELMILYCQ